MFGKLYIEDECYLKGFLIMCDVMVMSFDFDIGCEIVVYMVDFFKNLFFSNKVWELMLIDVVMVYEEFCELMLFVDEGNCFVQCFVEWFVDVDFLGCVVMLFQYQVDYCVIGCELGDVVLCFVVIYFFNEDLKFVLVVVDKVVLVYVVLEFKDVEIVWKQKEMNMLCVCVLFELDQVEEVLVVLNKFLFVLDVNCLCVDIVWNVGMWEDVVQVLQDLIVDEFIDFVWLLMQMQVDLILNWVVVLNFVGDCVVLVNMWIRYEGLMEKILCVKMFDVVICLCMGVLLFDCDSIVVLVVEVDMFKEFLDSYCVSINLLNQMLDDQKRFFF